MLSRVFVAAYCRLPKSRRRTFHQRRLQTPRAVKLYDAIRCCRPVNPGLNRDSRYSFSEVSNQNERLKYRVER